MQSTTTTHTVAPDQSDRSHQVSRLAFVIRYVVPVAALALLALVVAGAAAFVAVRIALAVVLLLVAFVALIGGLYHARAVRRDRQNFPPAGIFADAGGFRLHLLVMGEQTPGKPTVILESGMASFALNWHWIQTELARDTRVVAYDRAGFGWSDASPNPRDAHHCARELHTALQNAGIRGPYVLAGWSFGGLVVRAFADLYPGDVLGLTLVDASHPDQWLQMPVPDADRLMARMMRFQAALCRFGYGRVQTGAARLLSDGLPPGHRAALTAWCALGTCWETEARQAAVWTDVSRIQINQARPLGSLPVYVLGVSEQSLYGDVLTRLQEELTTLSTNTARTIVQCATHEALVAHPDHAAQVTAAIRHVMAAAETGHPLTA